MPRLRRSDCSAPGLTRRRAGRGFAYLDQDGERVADEETLERIRGLAIPPAWTDVWICPDPHGHLQATGVDDAGRKQYRYHDHWRTRRVGGEGYAEQNESFGLATIQKRHVRLKQDLIVFDYPAKSGQRRIQAIGDPGVRAVVERLKARRGGRTDLLAYNEDGRWVDVKAEDVNEYVKEASGDESFTAKDFRTWAATVLAAVAIGTTGAEAASKTARKRAVSAAVKHVADYLGNTPTVARNSYIDPRVFDRYLSGWTIGGVLEELGEVDLGRPLVRARIEAAVLDLIEEQPSPALEKVAGGTAV